MQQRCFIVHEGNDDDDDDGAWLWGNLLWGEGKGRRGS